MALRERVPEQLAGLLSASHPELRAAAVFTLGALVQVHTSSSLQITAVFAAWQLLAVHKSNTSVQFCSAGLY